MTVTCRRSAADSEGRVVCAMVDGVSASWIASAFNWLPHLPQYFDPAGLICRHDGHATDIGAPHSVQNLLPSGTTALQLAHSIRHPFEKAVQLLNPAEIASLALNRLATPGRCWIGHFSNTR